MTDMTRPAPQSSATDLPALFQLVRGHTEQLAAHLTPEDQCVQSMPDASPAKWHRAHTTWFFEQFVLIPSGTYQAYDDAFSFLFNSYYDAVGDRHPRPMRGMLTRPDASRIAAYRRHVDAAVLQRLHEGVPPALAALLTLGLNHEQQHQELMLTDILHAFAQNPLAPAALPDWREPVSAGGVRRFVDMPSGRVMVGHAETAFCFDNETPAHETIVRDFSIASHLVRNQDVLSFIRDGGYRTPSLWMSDGWAAVQTQGWTAPLYWRERDGVWWQMTLGGVLPLDPDAPVRHISWYEADAIARWANARLPTETEWETAVRMGVLADAYSHAWQWTESAYRPYPGYRPAAGAVGEYNGKFMVNQMVLRGGSLATPLGHGRPSYRNFFHPDKRWQFSGLRLARDVAKGV